MHWKFRVVGNFHNRTLFLSSIVVMPSMGRSQLHCEDFPSQVHSEEFVFSNPLPGVVGTSTVSGTSATSLYFFWYSSRPSWLSGSICCTGSGVLLVISTWFTFLFFSCCSRFLSPGCHRTIVMTFADTSRSVPSLRYCFKWFS